MHFIKPINLNVIDDSEKKKMIEALICLSFIFAACYIFVSNLLSKRLLGGLSYVTLIEDERKEFTTPSAPTNKKAPRHHSPQPQSAEKGKKTLSFTPSLINRSHLSGLYIYRYVKILYTFFAFFASTLVLLLITALLLFLRNENLKKHYISFFNVSLITTFIFIILGFYSSCSYRYRSKKSGTEEYEIDEKFSFGRFLISLLFPILSVFSQITIAKNIPFGPFDIHPLFDYNNWTIAFITFSVSLLLSASYATTIKLNASIHKTIKDPQRSLFTTGYYKKLIIHLIRELPATIFESIYNFVPTDIFFLLGIRIYFNEKVNDVLINNIFIVLVSLASIFKLFITRSSVQLIVLRDTFQALKLLDEKRTTKAWDNVTKTTEKLLTYIPQMSIALMLPSCINIIMCIIYGLSYVIASESSGNPNDLEIVPWLRIISIYVISSSEISTAMQQLVPEGL